MSPEPHQFAWNVWRAKALAVVTLALLLVAATCQLPGPGPVETGGQPVTGGVSTGGQASTGGDATGGTECRYVPSGRAARRGEASRIVQGQPSEDGAFPWAVALETRSGWQYCGASVIAPRWLLTAAHCQVEIGERAHVGANDLDAGGRLVEVVEVRNHPDWSGTTSGWDVAVLRLADDAGVEPVMLAGWDYGEPYGVAIGWGATCSGCDTVREQMYVRVPLISDALCQVAYAGQLDETMLCAGGNGPDSCQGDSGGPLVVQTGDGWAQLGIVSWGRGCGVAPGVYTAVPAVLDWIGACVR